MLTSGPYVLRAERGELRVSSWSDDIPDILRLHQIRFIRFKSSRAEVLARIAALAPPVSRVDIESELDDPKVIESFPKIEELNWRGPLDEVDLGRLPLLQKLLVSVDQPRFGHFARARSLRGLTLISEDLQDLTPVADLSTLEQLTVADSRLRSLKGIEGLSGLRELALISLPLESLDELSSLTALEDLTLHRLSRVRSIREIARLPIRRLMIDGLPKLDDLDVIDRLTSLESLELSAKTLPAPATLAGLKELRSFVIESANSIPSLAFIRRMPKLEKFYFTKATVADGDLGPLQDAPSLRQLRYVEKRSYRPRKVEILASIFERHGAFPGYEAKADEIDQIIQTRRRDAAAKRA
jgi:hypothetical protein